MEITQWLRRSKPTKSLTDWCRNVSRVKRPCKMRFGSTGSSRPIFEAISSGSLLSYASSIAVLSRRFWSPMGTWRIITKQHAAALNREHPGKSSLEDVRTEITDILSAQQVNKLFFAWLDEQRKETKITYFEASLQ